MLASRSQWDENPLRHPPAVRDLNSMKNLPRRLFSNSLTPTLLMPGRRGFGQGGHAVAGPAARGTRRETAMEQASNGVANGDRAVTRLEADDMLIRDCLEMDHYDADGGFLDRLVPGIVGLMQEIISANPDLRPAQVAAISIGMCEDAMLYMEENPEHERCADGLLDQQRVWFRGWLNG